MKGIFGIRGGFGFNIISRPYRAKFLISVYPGRCPGLIYQALAGL